MIHWGHLSESEGSFSEMLVLDIPMEKCHKVPQRVMMPNYLQLDSDLVSSQALLPKILKSVLLFLKVNVTLLEWLVY